MLSWLFTRPLPEGTPAPEFTLPDDKGQPVSLREFRGRNVVLVFYPGDETPTCRRQLCEFRDRWQELESKGAAVLGVNPQDAGSHARFRTRHAFPFPLLADAGQRVARLYNANGWLVRRTVYLVGPDGTIRYARRGKPAPEEVLAAVE